MGLKWSTVKPEHVTQACELLLQGKLQPRAQAKGLYLVFRDQRLPAKHVVRLAYCLANDLPTDAKFKFASGEGTLRLLRSLGFVVTREPA